MGQDTTEGDGGADESVELFVTTDGELEVAGRNTLDLEVLGGVLKSTGSVTCSMEKQDRMSVVLKPGGLWTYACEFEDFGRQVLENGGGVDGSLGTDAHLALGVGLEETLDTAAGELGEIMLAFCICNG